MKEASELHQRAMALIDEALLARVEGVEATYRTKMKEAFWCERSAALKLDKLKIEPSRSVLLRSAAYLAADCGNSREARRLARMGQAGDPPPEIEAELHDLLARLGDADTHALKVLFDRYYQDLYTFFARSGFAVENARKLARSTLQRVAREPAECQQEDDVLKMADQERLKVQRTRWLEAGEETGSGVSYSASERGYGKEGRSELPLLDGQRMRTLVGALRDLPSMVRRCVLMRIEGGLSVSQIAMAMGTSTTAVKQLFHQAREILGEAADRWLAEKPGDTDDADGVLRTEELHCSSSFHTRQPRG